MLTVSLLRICLTRSFQPFVFRGRYENHLDYASLDNLGLYVHIPFCRSLCSFCPYCKVVYDRQKAAAYQVALLQEIELVCAGQSGRQPATSLYFGGGTPALLIDGLKEMIDRLQTHFDIRGGIGVELHPDDITVEHLQKLRDAGVTMVSLGIQSFDQNCLHKLGRHGENLVGKLQMVTQTGFKTVDVDLIFAIPGQTDAILAADIQTAFANGATQVSTYPFIDFTFADNTYQPLSKKVKRQMLKNLLAFCRSIRLERTSVWTFAKPGTAKYSSVTRDMFLGFGVSATSLLQNSFKINTFSIDAYIERIRSGRLPTALTLDFSLRQRAAYCLFWSAYGLQLDDARFKKITGQSLVKLYGPELAIATRLGYLQKTGADYRVTDRAAAIYHTLEQAYTTAYIDKMWHIARNQAFPEKIVLH